MAIQGHVFWDQWRAYEGLYPYVIMLALSLNFLKIQPAKTLKIVVVDSAIVV